MKQMITWACLLFLFSLTADAQPAPKPTSPPDARAALTAFNQKFIEACRKMDHPADAAFWTDDGVDLLQGMQPMVGKEVITRWLNGLTAQLHGAKMEYCDVDWREIQIQGNLAYEWGINRQKIDFPPPQGPFTSDGKILLILRRQPDGSWKVALETWNTNPLPIGKS